MTDLSPAAQAVLDSGREYATQAWSDATHQRFNLGIAAALRAVADQVVPSDAMEPRNYIPMAIECQRIRVELLAIADELEDS